MSRDIIGLEAEAQKATDPQEKVDLLNKLSGELSLSNPNRGLQVADQARALAENTGYIKGVGQSLVGTAVNHMSLSNFRQAITCLEKALKISDKQKDTVGRTSALNSLANCYLLLCEYPTALRHHLECLRLRKELNDETGVAASLNNIASIYKSIGDYETSLDYFRQSLGIAEKIGSEHGTALVMHNIGLVFIELGDLRQALDYLERSLAMRRRDGNLKGEMITLSQIGNAYSSLGNYGKATECYQRSLRISETLGERYNRAYSFLGMGNIGLERGNHQEAMAYYRKGLEMASAAGDKHVEHSILLSLGKLYGEIGKPDDSISHLERSLSIAEEQDSAVKLSATHLALSRFWEESRDSAKALDHYRKYHECDKRIFNDNSDRKRQTLIIQLQVDRAEKEAEIQRLKNAELSALSLTDELTGLTNRRGFLALGRQALKVAERTKQPSALFFADLDGLKQVNDRLGHQAGDRLLAGVASALRASFRDADIVARIGGDEFVALAYDTGESQAEALRQRVEGQLDRPGQGGGLPTPASLSIGIEIYQPGSGLSLEQLMERADHKMYKEKNARRCGASR